MRGAYEFKGYTACAVFDAATGKFTYQAMPHPFQDRHDTSNYATPQPVSVADEVCDWPELPVPIAA